MSGQQQDRGNGSQIFQPLAEEDPSTIAGYRIAAKLGAGGMGKVYLSYTPGGRPVAIKVIRPEFGEDPEFRRRFAQEVQSAQRVQGLFTAPVIDADTEGTQPWLATAYVPGPSLAGAVCEHGALPVQAVLLLIAGMAEALHVIHGAGIVHRDLKPSNVLLAADGPRVIDFGIAYAADATSLTGSGVTIGTPSFMAPEQAAGRKVTPATDIFALGQVAAYAATGIPAFGEGTSHGVLYRIVHEEPDLTGIPERLTELVTRCLTKDPAGRPSIAEIIELCRTANAETVLRRPEDWLPAPVAADITVRAAAPAPVQTPPPAVAYAPTEPAPVAQTPATPPPGFGPPQPYQPHHPTQPAGAQGHPYAPTQHPSQAYPGPGRTVPTPANQAPAPKKNTGRRALFVALAAALVFGIAGGGTAYLLSKDDEKQTQGGSSPQGGQKEETSGTPGGPPDAKPADTSADDAGEKADPEPAEYNGINLTAGYHLTLADEDVRPQEGEDAGYELSYDTGGYLDAESTDGKLVLLDPSQEGSLEACRADTRFTENIATEKLSKGRQVCVFTGTGHIGLVTVQGFSAEDSPSKYMALDLTVWRNAGA
ncbi:serine/threonine protein kinase [Streptomyces sp. NPDC102441]|uniref:serine/threonine protein kinase n=1 Tax=Streptomyces sp. NPDC102441 TaxID=3366176 RepID=UPI003802F343